MKNIDMLSYLHALFAVMQIEGGVFFAEMQKMKGRFLDL